AVGCGATNGGTAQYDQTTCGNVAPFPSPASGTAISSCQTIATGGTYSLTTNLSASPNSTGTCLTLTNSSAIIIDLAGHTITGRVLGIGIILSGTHIYSSAAGGAITCSDSSANNPGCIYLSGSDTSITARFEV